MNLKSLILIIIIILGVYLLIGLIFTFLRSNSHYDYFVVKPDFIGNTDMSYWENRCVESNRNSPFPYAQWCVDGLGNFKTTTPNRFSWYFHMYSKRPSDWLITFFFWPLHFIGINLINFKSVGNVL